jgi:hypothetical protein
MNAFQEQCKATLIQKGYVKHYELRHTGGWFIGLWICIIICIVLAITSGFFAVIPAIAAVVCGIVSYINYKYNFALLQDRWFKYLRESGEGEKLMSGLFGMNTDTQQKPSTQTCPRVLYSDNNNDSESDDDDEEIADLDLFKGVFFEIAKKGKKQIECLFDPKYSVVKGDETVLMAVSYFNDCNQNNENNLVAVEYKKFDNYKMIVMYFDCPEKRVAVDNCTHIVLTLEKDSLEQRFFAVMKTSEKFGRLSELDEQDNDTLIQNKVALDSTGIIKTIRTELTGESDDEPKNIPFTITSEEKKKISDLIKGAFSMETLKSRMGWDRDKIN